jgi:hypothetical protein
MRISLFLLLAASSATSSSCDSDHHEREDVERQQMLYVQNQPPPFFNWSLERHLMIQLYKARNERVPTYSYVVAPLTGKVVTSCPSLGYPIPATTQLTNPLKPSGNGYALPQAEPNGLYTPPATHGTWVMCLGPEGKVEPSYWELDVLTFPRPMKEVDGRLVPLEGGVSSLSIDVKRAP